MDAKPWYTSKTIWFNLITGLMEFLALTQFQSLIPKDWLPYIALIQATGNLVLRKITTQPITFS